MSGMLRPLAALALAASVTTFAACRRAEAPPAAAPQPAPVEAMLGVWEGTLPCADCAGIVTRVTLFAAPGADGGRFELTESYLEPAGGGERGARRSGAFATESGTADDPAAVVYRLDVEDEGGARRFLVNGNDLQMLDAEGRAIVSDQDPTLRPLSSTEPAGDEPAADQDAAAATDGDETAPPKPGI